VELAASEVAVRRVVLRDTRDDRGTQFEAAQMEDDGTLRVAGHDTGPGVSEVFGAAITNYEWMYVVPSGRIAALAQALGTEPDDDVLDALARYYQEHGGRISGLLRSAEIAAEFDNWPS
jgi:serine/threonine protein kinase HipA of HipAB toxin-antitoxin module